MTSPKVISDIRIATMEKSSVAYGLIDNGAIAIEDDKIAWVGHSKDLPTQYSTCRKTSGEGRLVTPALIDCHTHVVFGGNRAAEFEMRLNGASYEEVARRAAE